MVKIFQDLTRVYKDKSKKEFKKIALKWVNQPKYLKKFMKDEYELVKYDKVKINIPNNISFCANLCKTDTNK